MMDVLVKRYDPTRLENRVLRLGAYRAGLFAVTDAQLAEGAAFALKGAPDRCSAIVRRGIVTVVNEKKRPAFMIIFR